MAIKKSQSVRRTPVRFIVVGSLAAVLLAGCGGSEGADNGGSNGGTSKDTKKAASDALGSWLDAVIDGDGEKACSMQTPAYTETVLDEYPGGTCEEAIEAASGSMAEVGADSAARTITVTAKSTRRATVGLSFDAEDAIPYDMVLDDDGWKVDHSGDSDPADERSEDQPAG